MEATFWCDSEAVKEQRHMMLPYGTVITQAKDQPPGSDFHITVELPWGFTIHSNADLKDVYSSGGPGGKIVDDSQQTKTIKVGPKTKRAKEFDEFMAKSKKVMCAQDSESRLESELEEPSTVTITLGRIKSKGKKKAKAAQDEEIDPLYEMM